MTVTETPGEKNLFLAGDIVETFMVEGKRLAKVNLKSCCILVPIDKLVDCHLGDPVEINATLQIQTVNAVRDPSFHE